MMKYATQYVLLALGLIACTSGHALASEDGQVTFMGQVVNAACTVNTDSQDLVVHIGQVRSSQFISTGDWAMPTPFQIKLEECDASVSQRAGVLFYGETALKDPQIFHAGKGAGAAKGIGIGIFDATGHLLIPGTTPLWKAPLRGGENVLRFIAKYRSTAPHVQAGNADAQIWFNVIYQ